MDIGYWQILIWKAGGFAYLEIRQSLTCNTVGQQVDRPSSIYSCSIGHILEHEFFCLGRLGSSGSKEKKRIWVILSNFWKWFFQLFAGKKKKSKFFKNILATALKNYIKWLLYIFFFVLKKVEKIGYHSNFNFECNTEIILKIVGFMVILRLSFSSYDASGMNGLWQLFSWKFWQN